MALSDAACRNAKKQDRPFKIFDTGGLYLIVAPSGTKTWRMKFKTGGKEKLLTLGRYPTLTLVKAREKRDEARQLLDNGVDPTAKQASADGAPVAGSGTFKRWGDAWLTNAKTQWSDITYDRIKNRIERNLYPPLGEKRLADIAPPAVLAALRAVEERGAIHTARRLKQYASSIFQFAIAEGMHDGDPTREIGRALRPEPRVSHRARVTERDLPRLLADIDSYDGDLITRRALQFTMLTAVRTDEIRFGTCGEIEDLLGPYPEWRIGEERMKMGREHIVPLSSQAVEILTAMRVHEAPREKLLFPSQDDPSKAMSENTMLYALYRCGWHSRQTVHGFRALFSTILNEQVDENDKRLFDHDWIEFQLAHVEGNKVRGAYNAAEYMGPRRRLMQWWADRLDEYRLQALIG